MRSTPFHCRFRTDLRTEPRLDLRAGAFGQSEECFAGKANATQRRNTPTSATSAAAGFRESLAATGATVEATELHFHRLNRGIMRVGTELATGEISHVPMGLAHVQRLRSSGVRPAAKVGTGWVCGHVSEPAEMAVTWKAAIQAEHGVLVQWHVRSFTPGREVLPNLGKLYISRASGITSTEWGADLAKLTRETATMAARSGQADRNRSADG